MPAYNFMARFAPLVESGAKKQTVRRKRKQGGAAPGKTLYLYTGQRTNECRLLRTAVCQVVQRVIITREGHLVLDGWDQSDEAEDLFAQADGFENYVDFVALLRELYGLPFSGECIRWW